MPHTAVELGIDQMSISDRLHLVEEIWDGIARDVQESGISAEEAEEVDRRLEAHRQNPEAAVPWEVVRAEALARIGR